MFAQVEPAVRSGGTSQLAVGGGVSDFNVDWGKTRKEGYTLWADWRPPLLPHFLNGLNLELEGRDIRWNTGDKPPGFRLVTGSGGAMYEWRHLRNFRPYAKGLIGFGGIYFGKSQGGTVAKPYTHDTRTIYAPGVGIEYRVVGNLWARADYEYQFWPKLTGNNFLNPQGFTFGAVYDISTGRRR
jgi:opacity protein-like surface antigen